MKSSPCLHIWAQRMSAVRAMPLAFSLFLYKLLLSARTTLATLLGVVLLTTAPGAQAAGLVDMFRGWKEAFDEAQGLVISGALVVGLMGIAYGCKLLIDKSNERENVKNLHIFVSIVGGAFLCILWFIATLVVETSGGSAADIGAAR